MLKTLLISLALALACSPARAQWTGSQYGGQTHWNNSQTGQSFSCSRYGNQIHCN